MQTLIELQEQTLDELEKMSQVRKISRDEIMQCALDRYLETQRILDQSFGLWADKGIDGLEYQRLMRDEW
jgi:metal-responsive CopG/Arc/MetJ family transcriptional regulator